MPEPTPKIFISYAWKNQPIAKRLQSDLKRDSVEVFVDYERIAGGDSLPARISVGLDWCNTLILLWSAEAANSRYVSEEWESAFHLDRKIIPCVLDNTALPALLRKRLYLNFAPYETGYAQLCRSLGVEPKARTEKIAPPEAPKSKLPTQHVEMPVPQPSDKKRETPPPKRKSFAETFRRKPKLPDPTPVLKPPEIVDRDATDATEIETRSRWPRRKIMTATLALIILAALALTWQMVCRESTTLSEVEVKIMLVKNDFFDNGWNKNGKGITHHYKLEAVNDDKIVRDEATDLMWEQGGSPKYMTYADAKKYIDSLNVRKFASYNDWRLPTLEEAMSLMEREKNSAGLYINPMFDKMQSLIWTADRESAGRAWVVDFGYGYCYRFVIGFDYYVRAVRS